MKETTVAELFGSVLYSYTRKQALEDGNQVDVSTTAKEAGITFPVYTEKMKSKQTLSEVV